MSQENVDRFIEATEAFNRGDVRAGLRVMDPEVQFEPVQAALQGTYAGHEGVREWFADIAEHYVVGSPQFATPTFVTSETACWGSACSALPERAAASIPRCPWQSW